jgi:hypothetical protein
MAMKNIKLKLISIISIIFIIIGWFITYNTLKNQSYEERGTFGDMFGGLNTLFSGLAFCGIIISIVMQSEELRLQREEIKANREELKRTALAQEEQGKYLNRQAENLKQSAKLSALNTLVNYYSDWAKVNNTNRVAYINKADKYVGQIEDILNQKND